MERFKGYMLIRSLPLLKVGSISFNGVRLNAFTYVKKIQDMKVLLLYLCFILEGL